MAKPSTNVHENRCNTSRDILTTNKQTNRQTEVKTDMLLYKTVNGDLPEYLHDMLVRNFDQHKRCTRYNELNFTCPCYKLETEAGRTFTVRRIKERNALPLQIRKAISIKVFKHSLFKKALGKQFELDHF